MVNDSKAWSKATEKVLSDHKELWQRMEKGDEGKAWNLANEMALSKSLAERTVELEQRVAELERHNELLRAVAEAAQWSEDCCPICKSNDLDGHDDNCIYQAAIDGGALEGKE